MRYVVTLIVAFLIIGCGKLRHPSESWPAQISNIQGFSPSQQSMLYYSVDQLNRAAGMVLVDINQSAGDYFPITVSLVDQFIEKASQVGYATNHYTDCKVDLAARLFEPGQEGLLTSVVWHEFGHCAGFDHDPNRGQIMYYIASAIETYTPEAIQRFANQLRAIALNPS